MLKAFFSNKSNIFLNLKYMILFGVLSALSAKVQFVIPGVEGAVSDPREIIAICSIVFLSN
ncbi:MAG: hypothetical protein KAR38_11620 [Calditrichia bacterium]|nr:hypothetical protein [Calditrichia bacterium]